MKYNIQLNIIFHFINLGIYQKTLFNDPEARQPISMKPIAIEKWH